MGIEQLGKGFSAQAFPFPRLRWSFDSHQVAYSRVAQMLKPLLRSREIFGPIWDCSIRLHNNHLGLWPSVVASHPATPLDEGRPWTEISHQEAGVEVNARLNGLCGHYDPLETLELLLNDLALRPAEPGMKEQARELLQTLKNHLGPCNGVGNHQGECGRLVVLAHKDHWIGTA